VPNLRIAYREQVLDYERSLIRDLSAPVPSVSVPNLVSRALMESELQRQEREGDKWFAHVVIEGGIGGNNTRSSVPSGS